MNMPVKERLLNLISYLNHGLVERDSTLKAALLAVLAGENLLLVGPPGTAKSLIARKVAECLEHDGSADHAEGYFEYLLTKFSTPEEIFGPLSISELKADRFKRNTAGYLPSVRMAFLDEIFKASSSILNALLAILNERLYHNGAEAQKVPLQALIAASNELPTGQEELDALYDRFLVRSFVDYVSEDNLPRLLDKPGPAPTITPFSAADLDAIRQAAEAVTLPTEIVSAIQKIWAGHKQMFKEDRRENLSDRRLRKVVGLLCISAATNGRKEVDLSDLLLLKDCLWNHPDNALKVRELVMNTLRAFSHPVQLSAAEYQAARDTPAQEKETIASKSIAKMGAVVKGYKGSGTEHDPILIENVHDLVGLERPEVGQQGYCFQQTDDIDCSDLTTWPVIDFKGRYNGSKHTVIGTGISSGQIIYLFKNVQDSHVSNLRLSAIGLANNLSHSEIFACESNETLLDAANDSTISCSYVGAGRYLVFRHVVRSTISQCLSRGLFIGEYANASIIQNCQILIDGNRDFGGAGESNFGGVAKQLNEGTIVENCFVAGAMTCTFGGIKFHGIAVDGPDSTIRQCALGALKVSNRVSLGARICRGSQGLDPIKKALGSQSFISSAVGSAFGTIPLHIATLENNVALDCHSGISDPNGPDGKSLSAKIFTQHYFEHTLGWDFTDVWQWSDAENQPELRSVGADAVKQQSRQAVSNDIGDLLTQQLTANLWL